MDSAIEGICQSIESTWPLERWSSVRVLIGVSGGADSICLLRSLIEMHPNPTQGIFVAHYDHALRPDSREDASFVAQCAASHELRFHAQRSIETDPSRSEADLRSERYQFLESAAKKIGARYVVLAHTRNDQVETILHNILRGTGVAGAAGIQRFRPLGEDLVIARPLLDVDRNTIEDALALWGQPYRTDASNADAGYKRNWIRHDLLPTIRHRFHSVDRSLLNLASNMSQLQEAVDSVTAELEQHAVSYSSDQQRVQIRCGPLSETPEGFVVALMQRVWDQQGWPRGGMTQSHWARLFQSIVSADATIFQLPSNLRVQRTPDQLSVERL